MKGGIPAAISRRVSSSFARAPASAAEVCAASAASAAAASAAPAADACAWLPTFYVMICDDLLLSSLCVPLYCADDFTSQKQGAMVSVGWCRKAKSCRGDGHVVCVAWCVLHKTWQCGVLHKRWQACATHHTAGSVGSSLGLSLAARFDILALFPLYFRLGL